LLLRLFIGVTNVVSLGLHVDGFGRLVELNISAATWVFTSTREPNHVLLHAAVMRVRLPSAVDLILVLEDRHLLIIIARVVHQWVLLKACLDYLASVLIKGIAGFAQLPSHEVVAGFDPVPHVNTRVNCMFYIVVTQDVHVT